MAAELSKREWSNREYQARRKLSANTTRTTSTLGLTGLGLLGASAAIREKPGMITKIPRLKKLDPDKLANTSRNVGVISGGISGLSGFNNAALTSQSLKQEQKKQRVTKNLYGGIEIGDEFGEINKVSGATKLITGLKRGASGAGRVSRIKSKSYRAGETIGNATRASGTYHKELFNRHRVAVGNVAAGAAGGVAGSAFANRKNDVTKTYDPERNRMKRTDQYQRGADAAAGAGALGTVLSAHKTGKLATKASKLQRVPQAALRDISRSRGRTALLGAGTGAALYAHKKIGEKKTGSWSPYAKSATSAFGVVHD